MSKTNKTTSEYLDDLLSSSSKYLRETFTEEQYNALVAIMETIKHKQLSIEDSIKEWEYSYIDFVKTIYQSNTSNIDNKLTDFLEKKDDGVKIIWGDCLSVLKKMKSESVGLMVTSPPYYNARDYAHWNDLNEYLDNMREIIRECYRVLDNHRVFVFNVGDIFDNDNLKTKYVWGKRRIPLGAYFTKIFEEEGFTFVDDFIWDKGEVQSQRQKNGNTPFPFYQYPINCYEHIFVFHKHRIDNYRYPCPVCGSLNVNGNAYSEIGVKSWECKNQDCFKRSKSNRGKRFSLKTIITQDHQNDDLIIDSETILKWRKDIVKINPVIKINSKGENILGHTAPYPIDIPEFAVKLFSYPGELVLDPFGGSFTSVIAAGKNNRIGVGIESNKSTFRDSSCANIQKKLKNKTIMEFDYNG